MMFGVISGLLWTYVLVGILIDLLNTIGILLGLDTTYLGLTVLAMGNALPDSFTTISMVRRNLSADNKDKQNAAANIMMAISGCYSGQLFGLLIGFGLSMLNVTLQKGPLTFN